MDLIKHMTLAAAIATLAMAAKTHAADISFLCAESLQPSIEELLPDFERASRHTVKSHYANLGTNADLVRKGVPADLAIVAAQQWEQLEKDGRIVSSVRVVVGKIGLGVFVRKGAPHPDIGSVEAFRQMLIKAPSVAVRDPAHGSPVGARTLALFEQLGLAQEIKPRLRLTADRPFDAVIRGEADIGFSTTTEIAATPEVDLVGAFPAELQNFIILTAAVPKDAKEPAAARALLDFLGSQRAIAVFKSKGIEAR